MGNRDRRVFMRPIDGGVGDVLTCGGLDNEAVVLPCVRTENSSFLFDSFRGDIYLEAACLFSDILEILLRFIKLRDCEFNWY